jgi:hypothetical protein
MPMINDFWYADFNTPTNASVISATEATSIGDSFERLELQLPIKVTSATARNETFPEPKQGDSVYRLDLGFEERYYETYSVKTNTSGKPQEGWYRVNSGPVTLANIDFQNVNNTNDLFASVFDRAYKFYEVRYSIQTPSFAGLNFRLRNGTSQLSSTLYRYSFFGRLSASSVGNSTTAASFPLTIIGPSVWHHGVVLLSDVNAIEFSFPKFIARSYASDNTSSSQRTFVGGCYQSSTQVVDGFSFLTTSGNMFGNAQVLGYN